MAPGSVLQIFRPCQMALLEWKSGHLKEGKTRFFEWPEAFTTFSCSMVGLRVNHPKRGKGTIIEVIPGDKRSKPYKVAYDNGEIPWPFIGSPVSRKLPTAGCTLLDHPRQERPTSTAGSPYPSTSHHLLEVDGKAYLGHLILCRKFKTRVPIRPYKLQTHSQRTCRFGHKGRSKHLVSHV